MSKLEKKEESVEELHLFSGGVNLLQNFVAVQTEEEEESFKRIKLDFVEHFNTVDMKEVFVQRLSSCVPTAVEFLEKDLFSSQMVTVKREKISMLSRAVSEKQKEMEKVLSGQEKIELTQWWLQLITKSTEDFLTAKGFLDNVTTFNYLTDEPLNWEGVKSNHLMLRRILESLKEPQKEEEYGLSASIIDKDILYWRNKDLRTLLEEMKEKIYPRIMLHVEKTLSVLRVVLGVTYSQCSSIEQLKQVFETKKASFTEKKKVTEVISLLSFFLSLISSHLLSYLFTSSYLFSLHLQQ